MRKRAVLFLLVLGLLVLLTACQAADTTEAPEAISGQSKGLLFAVTGGENTLYLFGSIHLGHEGMYPLSQQVYDAFERSDVLALELDITDLSVEALSVDLLSLMMYQDDTLMTDIVPEELFNEVAVIIDAEMGIPPFLLNHFKPWVAANMLVEIAYEATGLSADYGVETYFSGKAGDMEIVELETIEEQLAPFGVLSDESQVIYLEETLREMGEVKKQIKSLIALWQEADIEALAAIREELMGETETESLRKHYEAMTDARDARMARRIEELLLCRSGKTYFVIVGALHLAGENSIVDLLERKGYSVDIIR